MNVSGALEIEVYVVWINTNLAEDAAVSNIAPHLSEFIDSIEH